MGHRTGPRSHLRRDPDPLALVFSGETPQLTMQVPVGRDLGDARDEEL